MSLALPRFQQTAELVDDKGLPSVPFHIWWDQFAQRIEDSVNDLAAVVADIAALQAQQTVILSDLSDAVADIVAAQAAADAAALAASAAQTTANTGVANAATAQTTANTGVTNAATAQSTANVVKRTDKISGSSIVPALVLSASDAGSNASVVVASHTRVYGDGSQVSVAGHTFTGKSYSTKYAVYYDDTTTSDTTPTYSITSTITNALANFASGRHFVGIITTPASGGAGTTGGPTPIGSDPVDRGDMSSL